MFNMQLIKLFFPLSLSLSLHRHYHGGWSLGTWQTGLQSQAHSGPLNKRSISLSTPFANVTSLEALLVNELLRTARLRWQPSVISRDRLLTSHKGGRVEVGGSSDVLTQRISSSIFPLLIYTRHLGSGGGWFQSLKRTLGPTSPECVQLKELIKLTFFTPAWKQVGRICSWIVKAEPSFLHHLPPTPPPHQQPH